MPLPDAISCETNSCRKARTPTRLPNGSDQAPAANNHFGFRLAAHGSKGAIIGAVLDDTGATDAVSKYLFIIPSQPVAPSLTIQRFAPKTMVISWPSPSLGYLLQQSTDLGSGTWTTLSEPSNSNDAIKSVNISPMPGNRFFRLFKP